MGENEKVICMQCSCGTKIEVSENSQIIRQLFPLYPWVPSHFFCVECGYAIVMSIEKVEKAK